MKPLTKIALALACACPVLAQSPSFGMAFSFAIPVGEFREKTYYFANETEKEGYDLGLAANFWLSYPISRNLAFRPGVEIMVTEGTNTAYSMVYGQDTLFARHVMFSVFAQAQIFFEDAYLHRGPYIIAGLSGDLERWERSYDNYWDVYSPIWADRKTRLGGTFGLGHAFYTPSGFRFIAELTYHATLSGRDALLEPPKADHLKVSFGLVF
jgi:hypothetical protein